MGKKFWIAVAVMFVLGMLLDFVVHAVLLQADYLALPALYRSEQDAAPFFPYMLLAHVLMAGGFVWVYQQGRSDAAWFAQGMRFGMAMTILLTVPGYLIYYAVQPLPQLLVLKQIIFGVLQTLILGVAVAWLARPAPAA